MSRWVYVNGRYLPYGQAGVHVEDRGFQFADAVYEVCEIRGGRIVDESRHLARLERSLGELDMPMPMSAKALGRVIRETIRRNRVRDGLVYLQVTRGAAPRDFLFPDPERVPQTVVCTARSVPLAKVGLEMRPGIHVVTMPDERWARRDIKTVQLLASSLARQRARAKGAGEAWLVDGSGHVTEGAASNAWIVSEAGVLVTRPPSHDILKGVTRAAVFDLARREGLEIEERAFTVEEAKRAAEAFITSASNAVTPVLRIDDSPIGAGEPGPFTEKLARALYSVTELSI